MILIVERGERRMEKKKLLEIMLMLIIVSNIGVAFVHVKVRASGQPQRGPEIDTLQFRVVRSPAAQYMEMTIGPPVGSDVWSRFPLIHTFKGWCSKEKPLAAEALFMCAILALTTEGFLSTM